MGSQCLEDAAQQWLQRVRSWRYANFTTQEARVRQGMRTQGAELAPNGRAAATHPTGCSCWAPRPR